jgi:hypothetical protein
MHLLQMAFGVDNGPEDHRIFAALAQGAGWVGHDQGLA